LSRPITLGGGLWDPAVALAYVGGDGGLLSELLAIFIDDGPAHLETLRDAIARADVAERTRVAHMLKGQLRTLGAVTAASLAGRLEELGVGADRDAALTWFASLERELQKLFACMAGEEWQ
jgi:HPt (histidine-containing phosphotransfer) domain-containing protein